MLVVRLAVVVVGLIQPLISLLTSLLLLLLRQRRPGVLVQALVACRSQSACC
jgi:hypothetical protein